MGITNSATESKICTITAGIKMYKSIIKKKKTKHNKIVLLPKSKLNGTEVLISKALINSNISHDEFVLTNNVLKKIWWHERRNKKFKDFKILSKILVYLWNNVLVLFEV